MYRSLFSSELSSHWRREVLRTSLWFVPSLEVVAAVWGMMALGDPAASVAGKLLEDHVVQREHVQGNAPADGFRGAVAHRRSGQQRAASVAEERLHPLGNLQRP